MLAFVFVLGAGCNGVEGEPGITAPEPPRQVKLDKAPVFMKGDLMVRTIASFEVDARVLSRKRYRFGKSAKIAPIDLALGWGPMSDVAEIEKIKIWQSNRFYWWKPRSEAIARQAISINSSNMHIIPADKTVKKELFRIRKGEVVTLTGYLVNVSSDNFYWRTSLTRTDTGNGACELFYVTSVFVH